MESAAERYHEMNLHGVISIGREASFTLKRQALLFDRLVIASPRQFLLDPFVLPAHVRADIEFLKSKGLLVDSEELSLPAFSVTGHMDVDQIHRVWLAMDPPAKEESKSYPKESMKHKIE